MGSYRVELSRLAEIDLIPMPFGLQLSAIIARIHSRDQGVELAESGGSDEFSPGLTYSAERIRQADST